MHNANLGILVPSGKGKLHLMLFLNRMKGLNVTGGLPKYP